MSPIKKNNFKNNFKTKKQSGGGKDKNKFKPSKNKFKPSNNGHKNKSGFTSKVKSAWHGTTKFVSAAGQAVKQKWQGTNSLSEAKRVQGKVLGELKPIEQALKQRNVEQQKFNKITASLAATKAKALATPPPKNWFSKAFSPNSAKKIASLEMQQSKKQSSLGKKENAIVAMLSKAPNLHSSGDSVAKYTSASNSSEKIKAFQQIAQQTKADIQSNKNSYSKVRQSISNLSKEALRPEVIKSEMERRQVALNRHAKEISNSKIAKATAEGILATTTNKVKIAEAKAQIKAAEESQKLAEGLSEKAYKYNPALQSLETLKPGSYEQNSSTKGKGFFADFREIRARQAALKRAQNEEIDVVGVAKYIQDPESLKYRGKAAQSKFNSQLEAIKVASAKLASTSSADRTATSEASKQALDQLKALGEDKVSQVSSLIAGPGKLSEIRQKLKDEQKLAPKVVESLMKELEFKRLEALQLPTDQKAINNHVLKLAAPVSYLGNAFSTSSKKAAKELKYSVYGENGKETGLHKLNSLKAEYAKLSSGPAADPTLMKQRLLKKVGQNNATKKAKLEAQIVEMGKNLFRFDERAIYHLGLNNNSKADPSRILSELNHLKKRKENYYTERKAEEYAKAQTPEAVAARKETATALETAQQKLAAYYAKPDKEKTAEDKQQKKELESQIDANLKELRKFDSYSGPVTANSLKQQAVKKGFLGLLNESHYNRRSETRLNQSYKTMTPEGAQQAIATKNTVRSIDRNTGKVVHGPTYGSTLNILVKQNEANNRTRSTLKAATNLRLTREKIKEAAKTAAAFQATISNEKKIGKAAKDVLVNLQKEFESAPDMTYKDIKQRIKEATGPISSSTEKAILDQFKSIQRDKLAKLSTEEVSKEMIKESQGRLYPVKEGFKYIIGNTSIPTESKTSNGRIVNNSTGEDIYGTTPGQKQTVEEAIYNSLPGQKLSKLKILAASPGLLDQPVPTPVVPTSAPPTTPASVAPTPVVASTPVVAPVAPTLSPTPAAPVPVAPLPQKLTPSERRTRSEIVGGLAGLAKSAEESKRLRSELAKLQADPNPGFLKRKEISLLKGDIKFIEESVAGVVKRAKKDYGPELMQEKKEQVAQLEEKERIYKETLKSKTATAAEKEQAKNEYKKKRSEVVNLVERMAQKKQNEFTQRLQTNSEARQQALAARSGLSSQIPTEKITPTTAPAAPVPAAPALESTKLESPTSVDQKPLSREQKLAAIRNRKGTEAAALTTATPTVPTNEPVVTTQAPSIPTASGPPPLPSINSLAVVTSKERQRQAAIDAASAALAQTPVTETGYSTDYGFDKTANRLNASGSQFEPIFNSKLGANASVIARRNFAQKNMSDIAKENASKLTPVPTPTQQSIPATAGTSTVAPIQENVNITNKGQQNTSTNVPQDIYDTQPVQTKIVEAAAPTVQSVPPVLEEEAGESNLGGGSRHSSSKNHKKSKKSKHSKTNQNHKNKKSKKRLLSRKNKK